LQAAEFVGFAAGRLPVAGPTYRAQRPKLPLGVIGWLWCAQRVGGWHAGGAAGRIAADAGADDQRG